MIVSIDFGNVRTSLDSSVKALLPLKESDDVYMDKFNEYVCESVCYTDNLLVKV